MSPQVRVEERKRLLMLRWVHVPGQQLFTLPLGSPRIWTHSYKNEHWTQLQRKKVRQAGSSGSSRRTLHLAATPVHGRCIAQSDCCYELRVSC